MLLEIIINTCSGWSERKVLITGFILFGVLYLASLVGFRIAYLKRREGLEDE